MSEYSEASRSSSYDNLLSEDPNLSKSAQKMFQKTSDYLTFELSSNLQDYELLDKMNQTVLKNVEQMKKVTDDIVVTNDDLQQKFKDLQPLMEELGEIEQTVNKLENAAYRLDSYTQKLEERINQFLQESQSNS